MKKILPFVLLAISYACFGQVPGTISYQGILTDLSGNPVPDGSHNVVFRFYDVPTGGSPLAISGQTLNYGPFSVQTFKGLFSIVIGTGSPGNPSLPVALGNIEAWLGLSVDNQPELAPRIQLTSVPYAFKAAFAEDITAIDASKIASGTIDNARLDANLQDLADGTLSGTKIGTGIDAANVTSGVIDNIRLDLDLQDLADGSLSGSKVGGGIDAINISTGTLADARLSPHLQDLADGVLSGTKVDLVAGSNITLTPSGSSLTVTSPTDVRSVNGISGVMNIYAGNGISIVPSGNTLTINSNSPGGIGSDNALTFWTSTSSIGWTDGLNWDDKNRRLGIATATPQYTLEVSGDSYLNGTVYSTQTSLTVISDERTKESIVNFNDGLATVLQFRPVKYRYNGLGGSPDDGVEHIGVIAQEVNKVAPHMVSTEMRKLHPEDKTDTEMLVYNGSSLPLILVNAIKEQQNQIDALVEELNQLKTIISKLNGDKVSESGQVASSKRN